MLSQYKIIVLDYESGEAYFTNVVKPVEADFDEYVNYRLTALGSRPDHCYWMTCDDVVNKT